MKKITHLPVDNESCDGSEVLGLVGGGRSDDGQRWTQTDSSGHRAWQESKRSSKRKTSIKKIKKNLLIRHEVFTLCLYDRWQGAKFKIVIDLILTELTREDFKKIKKTWFKNFT